MRNSNLTESGRRISARYFLLICLFFFPHFAQAAQVNFNWSSNPSDDNVLGYKLYFGKKTACGDSSFCQFGGQSSIQGSSPVSIPLTDLSDPTNPSYNLDGLDEGDWCFRLTAYNEIGESNPTSALTIAIDTLLPSVSITAPTTAPNFTTTNSKINIAGEASDNLCIDSITWTSSTGGSGTASGTMGWSQENILLQEGDNLLTVTANDSAGNTAEASMTVTYTPPPPDSDTTPPTIDGYSPARGAVDIPINTDIVFHLKDTGVGVDQSSIVMTVEGAVVSLTSITGTPADCTVTYNPVTDFSYQQVVNVTIDASDLAGNAMAQDVYSFTTIPEPDTIPPTGTITIKGGDSLTRSTSVPVTISATDGGGSGVAGWLVSETQTTPPASDDAGWLPTAPTSYTLSSGDGLKTLYAWFKDGVGNISSTPATDEILLDTSTLKFNVTIELNNDPIDICFAPDQPLKANPFVTLESGNGLMTPVSGARVSPISDPCSDSPTYCVSYVPDINDTSIDIRIDEDQANPVIPESPGYAIASFFVTDPDQERATSFCIFNSQGGDNFLLHQQCEEFVSVECDPGVLYQPGQDLNPDECVLMRIVEIDPVSIPASPGIMATGLYDITLPDGVEIAPGKTITITFGFKLTNGLTQKDFDDGFWFFDVFYYDDAINDWKTSGISVTDVQWDSDNSGIVVFTTTHLTEFVVSMKQSFSKGSIGGSSSDKNLSASGAGGGGGCSVNNKVYGLSAGSVLVNILILFLPFVVNGIRSRYMAWRKKVA